ncbi:MAG: Gfo/Idh/MocA family oxidoreductase [Marivibrio sp.]|uniref:Gfo/Idh/MocA family protein n=1 Tax=Marivibrio sp. TaxID=2039719 RepID=UPI0032EF2B00
MSPIRRLAVLGLGSMGRKHAANALDAGLDVAAFDPAGAEMDSVKAMPSRSAALDWCDAVVVASPSWAHRDDLAAIVAAGRCCLIEKPFADRSEGVAELLAQAAAAGNVVAVAQNLRHHPAVERARTLLAEGAVGAARAAVSIGASYLPDWRPGRDYRRNYAADPASGGVIFDWVHEIDLLAHLLGPFEAAGAAADCSGPLVLGADEQAALTLRHRSGALSTLMLSYSVRPQMRRTTLLGPDGGLEIDIPARRLTAWDAERRPIEEVAFGGVHADDYRAELFDFLEAAAHGRAPRCPGDEALEILKGVLSLRAMAGLPAAKTEG